MEPKPQFVLIEDNLIDQFVTKKLLKKGLDVNPLFIANNGKEGIDWLIKNPNHKSLVILLDIQMPIMNGFEFLEEFSTLAEDLKNKIKIFVYSINN